MKLLKTAILFAGQGAQYPGMGKSLYAASPAAKAVFDLADALRPGTSAQIFTGGADTLAQTENTQPCLFAADLAAAEALRARGAVFDAAAGFSLGELPALAFSGVLEAKDAFALTVRRGRLMAEAARENPGGMAALLKISAADAEKICESLGGVWPVNYNSPAQTVVAGRDDRVAAACEAAKTLGGRAVKLSVSGAFHCPFMERAAEKLGEALAGLRFFDPGIPLYSNVTAGLYTKDAAPGLLSRQVCSPVRFQQTVENMLAAGIDAFVEVGPGRTLAGLVKKTAPDARVWSVCEYGDLLKTADELIP